MPQELQSALREPGRRHIVMCHPGHPDAELARLDPVVARRRMEYEALMRDRSLPERIWRPSRNADGPALDWPRLRRLKMVSETDGIGAQAPASRAPWAGVPGVRRHRRSSSMRWC